ncbi:MAG: MFS transporter [Myxococcales bacterium]|nr:MFS transporter [Myxococcales bacterium]
MEQQPAVETGIVADENQTCLSFFQKFTYALGQLSVSLSPALIASWLIYFYTGRDSASGSTLMLVSAGAMSMGGLIPRLLEAFAEPTVGHLSDKYSFRWGRRKPWIIFGTPLLMLFSMVIFFPPDRTGPGTTWFSVAGVEFTPNFVWLLVTHTGFWIMYTAVVAPYLSLLPEITPYNNERIKVSEYMAYSDVLGSVLGAVGVGAMITVFASGLTLGPIRLDNSFEVTGLLMGIFFAFTFYLSIWKIKEKPAAEIKQVHFGFLESVVQSFKNPTFPTYVTASAAIRMSVDVIMASLPFLVDKILGLDPGYAGYLQGVVLIGAALMFPFVSRMATKRGKKHVFNLSMVWFGFCLLLLALTRHFPFLGYPISWIASLFGASMSFTYIGFAHAIVVLFLCAFAVSVIFVLQRPVLTDVIDWDEKLTGYRREAMYNGMEGLISKPASGIAYFIVPLMNDWWGATPDRPYGVLASLVVAAAIMFLGYVTFRHYPIEK